MPQPEQPVEYGPLREIWLAKIATPATKHSFLIRDDSRSKQGAVFSKTVRLGDPVTLGPLSTWRQTTWEGGAQQETWNDKAMYLKGTIDVTTLRGKGKLWPGFKKVYGDDKRANTRYIMCPGPVGFGSDSPLFIGENNDNSYIDPVTGTTVPPGGFRVYRYDPAGAGTITTLKSDFSASIRFISRIADQGDARNALLIGTAAGEFWVYHLAAGAWYLEATDANFPAQPHCAVTYKDATYLGQLNLVAKRTWVTPGPATYSGVQRLWNAQTITSMVVWNNRIWMSASILGGINQVLVSDGSVVVPAFDFPGDFFCMHMKVHYGSLYFCGWQQGGLGTSGVRGQVWRYNGSSLTKLYEAGTGADGEDHAPFQLASYKQFLAWTRPGVTSNGKKPGIVLYDAELDSIIDGPTIDMDTNASWGHATGLVVWADTFAASFKDQTNYNANQNRPTMVAHVKKTGAVRHSIFDFGGISWAAQPASRDDSLTSSVFDGEIPGEQKVWMTVRARIKIPAPNCSINASFYLDEATTGALNVGWTYDAANTGWRTVSAKLFDGSKYLRSSIIQYKVSLINSDSGSADSTANPEIDFVEVDYMVSPIKRRQWQLRALCWDGALRLDGTANPLTTTQALEDKLEELWGEALPVLYWDAGSAGGTPAGAGTEVMLKDFNAQSYRIDSEGTAINSEVGLTLVEIA